VSRVAQPGLSLHHRAERLPHRLEQGRVAGADLGIKKEDATVAELLKAQGYATGQFGKNHLGDKDDMLPTATASMSSTAISTI